MNLHYAKYRLGEWGKWNRSQVGGYAQLVMDGTRGAPTQSGEEPPHIQEISILVSRLDPGLRLAIVVDYTQSGTSREKAMRLGLPKSSYLDRVEYAVTQIHFMLDGACISPSIALEMVAR